MAATPSRRLGRLESARRADDFFEQGRDFVTALLEKMVTRPTDAASRVGR